MTDKELRALKREDLLELLLVQSRELERCKGELARLAAELSRAQDRLRSASAREAELVQLSTELTDARERIRSLELRHSEQNQKMAVMAAALREARAKPQKPAEKAPADSDRELAEKEREIRYLWGLLEREMTERRAQGRPDLLLALRSLKQTEEKTEKALKKLLREEAYRLAAQDNPQQRT